MIMEVTTLTVMTYQPRKASATTATESAEAHAAEPTTAIGGRPLCIDVIVVIVDALMLR